jgi:hypothetical protein
MLRLLACLTFFIFLFFSCAKKDPVPQMEPCVEGAYYNDNGSVYYVICPELNPTKCVNILKFIFEVKGYNGGQLGKLTVTSLTSTTVKTTERIITMNGQKFEIRLSFDKSMPTKHNVKFELPESNCTVNDALEFYSYTVDTPCGSQVDLKFNILCED